jgi:hypothetical protein
VGSFSQSITRKIRRKLNEKVIPKMSDALVEKTKQLLEERRYWAAFEGRITTRRNPNAPQKIAFGAVRDTVDSGETVNSLTPENGNMQAGVSLFVDDAEGFTDERPWQDALIAEVSFAEIFKEALDNS